VRRHIQTGADIPYGLIPHKVDGSSRTAYPPGMRARTVEQPSRTADPQDTWDLKSRGDPESREGGS
jgi:hypothetical protein